MFLVINKENKMRNATFKEVCAFNNKRVLSGVMYKVKLKPRYICNNKHDVVKAHLHEYASGNVLFESADGNLRFNLDCVDYALYGSVTDLPKKKKKPHVKGTKPWRAYNSDTIKVGDKVRLRDGSIATVDAVLVSSCYGKSNSIRLQNNRMLHQQTGRYYECGKHECDIVGMYDEETIDNSKETEYILGWVNTDNSRASSVAYSISGLLDELCGYYTNQFSATNFTSLHNMLLIAKSSNKIESVIKSYDGFSCGLAVSCLNGDKYEITLAGGEQQYLVIKKAHTVGTKECVVKNCTNKTNEVKFVGNFCKPCYDTHIKHMFNLGESK